MPIADLIPVVGTAMAKIFELLQDSKFNTQKFLSHFSAKQVQKHVYFSGL